MCVIRQRLVMAGEGMFQRPRRQRQKSNGFISNKRLYVACAHVHPRNSFVTNEINRMQTTTTIY